jgi:hypothetical protein
VPGLDPEALAERTRGHHNSDKTCKTSFMGLYLAPVPQSAGPLQPRQRASKRLGIWSSQ